MTRWGLIDAALLLAVVATGISVVQVRHEARILYNELQTLESRGDELQVVWSQLQLEQAAWSEPGRVGRVARDELGMDKPQSEDIVLIEP